MAVSSGGGACAWFAASGRAGSIPRFGGFAKLIWTSGMARMLGVMIGWDAA